MKKYTLILYFNELYHVCSTNDCEKFLAHKKRHYKDLKIIMYINGDYRRKIRHFGIKNYLRSHEGYTWYETLNLQLAYNRGKNT